MCCECVWCYKFAEARKSHELLALSHDKIPHQIRSCVLLAEIYNRGCKLMSVAVAPFLMRTAETYLHTESANLFECGTSSCNNQKN
jgi:hypothetical protein